MRLSCRAARESPADSQYYLVEASAWLSIDASTVSLAGADGSNLLHMPLASCLFGASPMKLLIVPASRAPAWALQMADATPAAAAIRDAGCALETADGAVAPPLTEGAVEAMASSPNFVELVAQLEAVLARRASAGLPDLLLTRAAA